MQTERFQDPVCTLRTTHTGGNVTVVSISSSSIPKPVIRGNPIATLGNRDTLKVMERGCINFNIVSIMVCSNAAATGLQLAGPAFGRQAAFFGRFGGSGLFALLGRYQRTAHQLNQTCPRILAVEVLRTKRRGRNDHHTLSRHALACQRFQSQKSCMRKPRTPLGRKPKLNCRRHLIHILPTRTRRTHELFIEAIFGDREGWSDVKHGNNLQKTGPMWPRSSINLQPQASALPVCVRAGRGDVCAGGRFRA